MTKHRENFRRLRRAVELLWTWRAPADDESVQSEQVCALVSACVRHAVFNTTGGSGGEVAAAQRRGGC